MAKDTREPARRAPPEKGKPAETPVPKRPAKRKKPRGGLTRGGENIIDIGGF